jgi:hypothetical protein
MKRLRFTFYLLGLFLVVSCQEEVKVDEVELIEESYTSDTTYFKRLDFSRLYQPIDSLFDNSADSIPVTYLSLLKIDTALLSSYVVPDSLFTSHNLKIYLSKSSSSSDLNYPYVNYQIRAYSKYNLFLGSDDIELLGSDIHSEIVATEYLMYANNYIGDNFTGEGAFSTVDSLARYEFYKFSDSSFQHIESIPSAEIDYLIQEIYARHGLIFNDVDMKSRFENVSWYHPLFTNIDSSLSEEEKELIQQLKRLEKNN